MPTLLVTITSPISPRRRRAFIDDFPFDDPLFIPRATFKRESGLWWRGVSLLPFDFTDAFTAVAFQVFGDFDETEDVLLLRAD